MSANTPPTSTEQTEQETSRPKDGLARWHEVAMSRLTKMTGAA